MTGRIICLVALALATACTSAGPKSAYPPPQTLELAPLQRQEFLDSYLQGYLCQAETLFDQSVDNYLRQDDFCRAAYNYYLVHKLRSYVGVADDDALDAARRLAELAGGCDTLPPVDELAPFGTGQTPERDRIYEPLLASEDYGELAAVLAQEGDALYASVYARRAAAKALAAGKAATARRFLDTARRRDAAQGWVVFLIEDWQRLGKLADNDADRDRAAERVEILKSLLEPCPF